MTERSAAQEAADPTTAPARLAELAHRHPEVRALVASNPAAYPGLLEWLAQRGDAEVQAAINARGVAAPPEPQPVDPGAAKPVRGDGDTRLRPGVPRPLLLGGLGAATLVVVAAVVLAITLSGARGPVSDAGAVPVAEIATEPSIVWSVDSFHPEITPTIDTTFETQAVTVAPHRALVTEIVGDQSGGDQDVRSVLLDTSTGLTVWELPGELEGATLVPAPAGAPVVVFTADDRLTSVRVSDGSVAGRMDDVTVVTLPDGRPIPALGGDLLVRTDDEVVRIDPVGMTERWSVPAGNPDHEQPFVGGDVLIVGSHVYSLSDGRERSWTADAGYYGDLSGRLFFSTEDSDRLALIDSATGAERWSIAIAEDHAPRFWTSDAMAIYDGGGMEISVVGLDDGEERWRAGMADPAYGFVLAEAAGVVLLPTASGLSTAYDLATGERLYDSAMTQDGGSAIGVTARTIYLAGAQGRVDAFDARTGATRWSLEDPYDTGFSFAFWGGDLVAFHQYSGIDSGDQPRYLGLR